MASGKAPNLICKMASWGTCGQARYLALGDIVFISSIIFIPYECALGTLLAFFGTTLFSVAVVFVR